MDEEVVKNEFSRRKFIGALAGLSGAAVAGSVVGVNLKTSEASANVGLSKKSIPFFGEHQSGILNAAPASAIVCAFNLTTTSKQSLSDLLQILTIEIEKLTQGISYNENDRKYPPKDNLVNGETTLADELTLTLGLGASIFDDRFELKDKKPSQLIDMPRFPNDRLDESRIHGDLVIQICAQHSETCLRALRILMKVTRDSLVLKWLEQGFIQPNTLSKGKTSTRNLMGFKDGTANPDVQDEKLMNDLVWVDKNSGEPDWAIGGTYMVTRSIRMFVEHWDRTTLDEQEQIMGRHKAHGEPIGSKNEDDDPVFYKNPSKDQISLDAHIRLANPRTKATNKNVILRRGYNYSRGFDDAGQLDQGLLFVCFQKSLQDGFMAVQNRLNGELLEEYIQPNGGGFFFVLPGVKNGAYLGQKLFL